MLAAWRGRVTTTTRSAAMARWAAMEAVWAILFTGYRYTVARLCQLAYLHNSPCN